MKKKRLRLKFLLVWGSLLDCRERGEREGGKGGILFFSFLIFYFNFFYRVRERWKLFFLNLEKEKYQFIILSYHDFFHWEKKYYEFWCVKNNLKFEFFFPKISYNSNSDIRGLTWHNIQDHRIISGEIWKMRCRERRRFDSQRRSMWIMIKNLNTLFFLLPNWKK